MRKPFLLSLLVALLTTLSIHAYDFQSGDLYYNITSDNTVEVTYQEQWSESNYQGLTTATIPATVTDYGTTYSVTSIGDWAFYGCSSLTSVTIPNSVTSIGNGAFYECSSLTSIILPNSVTSIGYHTFYNCSSLTSITIPNSVTTIGNNAFYEVPNIVYNGTATGSPWGARNVNGYVEGYLVYADDTKTTLLACSAAAMGEVTLPNSVTSIGYGAFYNCSSLTSITIPNSVTSIRDDAFYNCSSLTSIIIPNSVTSIGEYAFEGCTSLPIVDNLRYADTYLVEAVDKSLSTYTIKAGTKWIGSEAFSGCSSLTSITLPNSVTSIGIRAFSGCTSLPVVDNLRYADTYLVEAVDKSLSTYTIKAGTKWIGDDAFEGCSSLTSITLPNSVTSIGGYAFEGCSSLTSITLPNSVTSIEFYAFYECSSLTSITIPNSVTSIGVGAFSDCSSLTSITIPNSVTSIGESAFEDCTSLTSVTIGNSVTSILDYAFYNCSSLTSITIPNSVTSIGSDAFSGCSSLTSITIGNSVTSIGSSAFYGCSSLADITIGNSVTSIGEGAFYECTSLADIYCYATTPPVCYVDTEYGTFVGVSKHCRIHVPAGTLEAYQWAPVWSDFYHFFEISELPDGAPTDQVGVTVTGNYATFSWPVNPTASSYTLTITKDGEVFCTLIFNNMGQLVGMAFAPARNGKQSANQGDAQSTAYGFSFVVTNLSANSHYTYTFTVNGADNEVIETYSGTFDTTEETALSETEQANKPSSKILRDGQVLILRNGVAYDMMGNML